MTSVTPLSSSVAAEPERWKQLQLGPGTDITIVKAIRAGVVQRVRLALLETAGAARHRAIRVVCPGDAVGTDIGTCVFARGRCETAAPDVRAQRRAVLAHEA